MKWIQAGILTAAWAAIAACSPLQPVKQEAVNTFALEARFDNKSAVPAHEAPVVLVSPMRARPGFDSQRMAFVRKPHEIEYFTKNQWVDMPARMLTPLLAQALESTGAYRAVLLSQSGASANLRLESEIVRLQQEFFAVPSQIRLGLRVQLVDIEARKVLATREFDVTEAAPGDDPYGGVVAANRAVSRILGEIAEFCALQAKTPKP